MDAVIGLLLDIKREGVRLAIDGDRLVCRVPRQGISDDLVHRIQASSHALVALLHRRTVDGPVTRSEPLSIPRADRNSPLPLSHSQERLWFIQELDPMGTGYSVSGAVRIDGELDVDALCEALDIVVERHEVLRTVFPSRDGKPYQAVLPASSFSLKQVDLAGNDASSREVLARKICQAEAARGFDLSEGPVFRGVLIRLTQVRHVLMLNMHHIVSDGWSIGILVSELSTLLTVGRDMLPPLPIQYGDYAAWQRSQLEEGGVLERHLAYWREALKGLPDSFELPLDYPRDLAGEQPRGTHTIAIDRLLLSRVKQVGRQVDASLFMVLLAALDVLLHRYTGQVDFCIGSALANRSHVETSGLIGMFVNTLPLRSRIEDRQAFADFLSSIKATCLDAYEHQDTPFAKIVEVVRPQRRLGVTPLFQVMMVLQEGTDVSNAGAVAPFPYETPTSPFDLSFEFTEDRDGLSGLIEYNRRVLDPRRIEQIGLHFIRLLQSIADRPSTKIGDLDILGAERYRILIEFNDTRVPIVGHGGIHRLFVEQASRAPDRIAIRYGQNSLSYTELLRKVDAMASALRAAEVGPGEIVGLCAVASPNLIAAILAVLTVGAAFLPLDPAYPAERLAYMVGDSGATHVLVDADGRDALGMHGSFPSLIDLDELAQATGLAERVQASPGDASALAYVIYTSGSTGKSKGVAVEHRSLVNHNLYARERYGIRQDDVQIQSASISFDLFVEEIFTILTSGACLVLLPRERILSSEPLREAVAEYGVTVLNLPTALFHELADWDMTGTSLRTVIVGGERLDHRRATIFLQKMPEAALFNTYGPTETTIISTLEEVTLSSLDDRGNVPIGRPIANTQIYILDAALHPQPVGVPGELYIAGEGLARGYLNRPELTEQRFVANPFDPGTRMYRSGDRARWLDDGRIEFTGRADNQVKIRGFRIEPGEIEAVLDTHPIVASTAVVVQGEATGRRLIAFYVRKGNPTPTDEAELQFHLKTHLPEFMVPATYVALDELPITPGGKTDRRSLECIDVAPSDRTDDAAPRSPLERRMLHIWAEMLERPEESIGITHNFFELGGHSLLAVRLMSRIEQSFGTLLPLATLFAAPTVADLVQHLRHASPARGDSVLVAIQKEGNELPIFAAPGAGGNVLCFHPLAKALGMQQPLYGLQAVGLDGATPPLDSVRGTAAVNIEAIRSIQPSGPYRLLGYSYGGVVAFETARLLFEQGETVEGIMLIDSFPQTVADDSTIVDEREAVVSALAEQGLNVGEEQFEILLRVFEASRTAYASYEPVPLLADVPVTLYRAAAEPKTGSRTVADLGWTSLLRAQPRIFDIDAGHFSILDTMAARLIASDLKAALFHGRTVALTNSE